MKTNNLGMIIVVIITVVLLGYAVLQTSSPVDQVTTKVEALTPVAQRKAVDESILSNKTLHDIETLKVFGNRPVQADPGSLNRSNPFDGI